MPSDVGAAAWIGISRMWKENVLYFYSFLENKLNFIDSIFTISYIQYDYNIVESPKIMEFLWINTIHLLNTNTSLYF